jgi:DNA (cytosine-5)-methyltransferase 1
VSQQSISKEAAFTLRIGSLCTGYGGLDKAVELYFNAETIWCAEFDKYASQVVEKHFDIPNLGNIKNIAWEELHDVDILTAGYPCQPFSVAGSRKGSNDSRHIWPDIFKGISILRPRVIILENVKGHLNLGFDVVLKDLAKQGYDANWEIVRAAEVGAPHHRRRLFIIAYLRDYQFTREWDLQELGRRHSPFPDMSMQEPPQALDQGKLRPEFTEYMMGLPVGWVTSLPLSRTQKFKIIGNGVVPQQAFYAIDKICDSIHSSYSETVGDATHE